MRSPAARPASAAGIPVATSPTCDVVTWMPVAYSAVKRSQASTKFPIGPADTMKARAHIGFTAKEFSCEAVSGSGSLPSSSCPIILT
jgi:hypothetical protein